MDWAASIAQEAYTNGVNPVTGEELHVHGEDDAATTSETCLPCRISKVRDGPRAALPRSRLGDALNAQVRCDKQVPCGRCRRRKVTCIPQTARRGAEAPDAPPPVFFPRPRENRFSPAQRGKRRHRRKQFATRSPTDVRRAASASPPRPRDRRRARVS